MAKGPTIKLFGKSAGLVAGDLLERELGINTTSKRLAFSTTGSDLIFLPQSREVLLWTGSAYPAKPAGVAFALYVGPVDPETVGVVYAAGDKWEPNPPTVTDTNVEKLIVLGANQQVTGIVTTDIAGLAIPVKAGVTYKFFFEIMFNSNVTTSGASGTKWGLTGPANSLLSWFLIVGTLQNSQSVWNSAAYEMSTPGNNNSQASGNTARLSGKVTPTADGNLTPRFSGNVAGQIVTAIAKSEVSYRALP